MELTKCVRNPRWWIATPWLFIATIFVLSMMLITFTFSTISKICEIIITVIDVQIDPALGFLLQSKRVVSWIWHNNDSE